jgi:hypothetical protein
VRGGCELLLEGAECPAAGHVPREVAHRAAHAVLVDVHAAGKRGGEGKRAEGRNAREWERERSTHDAKEAAPGKDRDEGPAGQKK